MVYVTRKETFSSAHRLFNPTFTPEQNDAVFDMCNNVHGHNYTLEVTVVGSPDPATGYVVDLKLLKTIIRNEIVSKVDHRHINDTELFRGIIPTAENLAVVFWRALEEKIPSGRLHRVRVAESDNNIADYYGEPIDIPVYPHQPEEGRTTV